MSSRSSSSPPDDGRLPSAGSIYRFQTSSLVDGAPRETGRYAAIKVLAVTDDYVAMSVLDGIWTSPPTIDAASSAATLHQYRFSHTGRPAACGVNINWWTLSDLNDVSLLGNTLLSPAEMVLGEQIVGRVAGSSYSTMAFANHAAEGEWRWRHDREKLIAEYEDARTRADAERAQKEERYRTRLKGLTWEKLLTETPFEGWSPCPPFPPKEFTEAARVKIRSTCRELCELGPRPPKAKVRTILQRCVEWFNEANNAAGEVIETEERRDICAVLEEMAYVAKRKGLALEIDEWRTW